MTGRHLTTLKTPKGMLRREKTEHHLAIRTLTIAGRSSFTDAIKLLNEYTDPSGDCSKSAKIDKNTGNLIHGSFIHFTRELYRCFGLTEAQAEARLAGDSLRDILNEIVLMAIYQAELEAALFIASMIKMQELRKSIKEGIKSIFAKHASNCEGLQAMARTAA